MTDSEPSFCPYLAHVGAIVPGGLVLGGSRGKPKDLK